MSKYEMIDSEITDLSAVPVDTEYIIIANCCRFSSLSGLEICAKLVEISVTDCPLKDITTIEENTFHLL